jgi:hypothetical protein
MFKQSAAIAAVLSLCTTMAMAQEAKNPAAVDPYNCNTKLQVQLVVNHNFMTASYEAAEKEIAKTQNQVMALAKERKLDIVLQNQTYSVMPKSKEKKPGDKQKTYDYKVSGSTKYALGNMQSAIAFAKFLLDKEVVAGVSSAYSRLGNCDNELRMD